MGYHSLVLRGQLLLTAIYFELPVNVGWIYRRFWIRFVCRSTIFFVNPIFSSNIKFHSFFYHAEICILNSISIAYLQNCKTWNTAGTLFLSKNRSIDEVKWQLRFNFLFLFCKLVVLGKKKCLWFLSLDWPKRVFSFLAKIFNVRHTLKESM